MKITYRNTVIPNNEENNSAVYNQSNHNCNSTQGKVPAFPPFFA